MEIFILCSILALVESDKRLHSCSVYSAILEIPVCSKFSIRIYPRLVIFDFRRPRFKNLIPFFKEIYIFDPNQPKFGSMVLIVNCTKLALTTTTSQTRSPLFQ